MKRAELGFWLCLSCVVRISAAPLASWETALSRANYLRDSNSAGAEAEYGQAEALAQAEGRTALAKVWNDLALLLIQQERFTDAEAVLRKTLALHEQDNSRETAAYGAALHNFALTQQARGQRVEAEKLLLRAIGILERTKGPEDTMLVPALGALSVMYVEWGRLNEARVLTLRELKISSQLGQKHPVLANRWMGLSEIERLSGNYYAARSAARNALRMFEGSAVIDESSHGASLDQLGRIEYEMGNLRAAAENWNRALGVLRGHSRTDNERILSIKANLAGVAALQGRLKESEQTLLNVVESAERERLPMVAAFGRARLGALYSRQKQFARAEQLLIRSLQTTENELGSGSTQAAVCRRDLAEVQLALNRAEDAARSSSPAIAMVNANPVVATAWIDLLRTHAQALKRMKRKDQAVALEKRIQSLREPRSGGNYTVDVADFSRSDRTAAK